MLWSLLIQYIVFEKNIFVFEKKYHEYLCESSVKSLKTLLFEVTLSGTNILRDVCSVLHRPVYRLT